MMRIVLYVMLVSTAAIAQWNRYVDGNWDTPPAHDLRYFQGDPCARSDKKDRFLDCPMEPQITTKLRVAGKIGNYVVYDLMYFEANRQDSSVQSILVGTGHSQLHEIYVRDKIGTLGALFPVEIVFAEKQPIVKASLEDGGLYNSVFETYFIVSEHGVTLLSFTPVSEAAEKVLPKDMMTYQPASSLDFKLLIYSIGAEQLPLTMGPKVSCCVGHIEVPFRIVQGKVIAGQGRYFSTFMPSLYR
jgi:hypothetical protein